MPDPLSDLQRLGQEFDADGVEAVEQVDREAAWPFARFHCLPDQQMRERWFAGYYDKGSPLHPEGDAIQAFARHRIAAIAAARPMIEAEAWRPIETAPRDVKIWAYGTIHGDYGYTPDRQDMIKATWDGKRAVPMQPMRRHDTGFTATHWMPLPAPPAIRALGEN
jgi:hypothetical protein